MTERRPPGHLSPSSAKVLDQCPRRFEYSKVFHLPEPTSREALLGTVVHKVWELLSGEGLSQRLPRLALRLLDEVWGEITQDEHRDPPRHLIPSDPDVGRMVADFTALGLDYDEAMRFYRQAWAAITYVCQQEPVVSGDTVAHRELALEVTVGGVPFKGRADRVDRDPDGLTVLDLKTGKAPFDPRGRVARGELAKLADQLLLYAPAVEAVLGERVVSTSLWFVGERGQGWVPVDLAGVDRAVDRFGAAWAAFQRYEAAQDYPPRPSALCAWCPHFERCAEGSAQVLALRAWMRDWEVTNGRECPARTVINDWPGLRRAQWVTFAREAWPAMVAAGGRVA